MHRQMLTSKLMVCGTKYRPLSDPTTPILRSDTDDGRFALLEEIVRTAMTTLNERSRLRIPAYLVYWKTVWADDPLTTERRDEPDWHSRHEPLIAAMKEGGELWVVGRTRATNSVRWLLLEHFDVLPGAAPHVTRNGAQTRRLIGVPATARVFSVDQPDLAPMLGQLQFKSSKPIGQLGGAIGQAIQSPRELTTNDVTLLRAASQNLKPRLTTRLT